MGSLLLPLRSLLSKTGFVCVNCYHVNCFVFKIFIFWYIFLLKKWFYAFSHSSIYKSPYKQTLFPKIKEDPRAKFTGVVFSLYCIFDKGFTYIPVGNVIQKWASLKYLIGENFVAENFHGGKQFVTWKIFRHFSPTKVFPCYIW